MKNKKGISAIVATVLIILITVAAITIVWMTIVPLITNQLDAGTICMDAETTVTVVSDKYTCVETNDNVSVGIKRGSGDFELVGLQILVSVDGNSEAFIYNETDLVNFNTNEKKVFSINSTLVGTPEEVSVAAVIAVDGTEKTCRSSLPVTLLACS